jgi:uncharacterized protein (DUF608 family)
MPETPVLETSAETREETTVHTGPTARYTAMPLGGIGTGQIALGADGGLRQWQIFNQINHTALVPDSFFAIRVSNPEPPLDVIRVLQSREVLAPRPDPTPLVSDDIIPPAQRRLLDTGTGVESTVFSGVYPFARVQYEDAALPLQVSLEAWSPFVPLDVEGSSLPAIFFTFTLRNTGRHKVDGHLAATLQNAVGWDGITPIDGNRNPLYGGNTNRVRKTRSLSAIIMENLSLPDDHPGAGQMALATFAPYARPYERWTTPEELLRFLAGTNPAHGAARLDFETTRSHRNAPISPAGPSPAGTTWNGALAVPYWLAPGESTEVTFLIAWHFPNRYVNFDQFGPARDLGRSRLWLGNAYAARSADVIDVLDRVVRDKDRLERETRAWEATVRASTLPGWLIETLAAQGSLIRSPTTFQAESGAFFGFEGSLGRSTSMWNGDFGGSCPLNCTHVWNYEMALSKLFPTLERSMRETDLEVVQAPEGYIPHRTVAPLFLRQMWDAPIGGPTNPALDGMLGEVLKTYREVRQSGDRAWATRLWPRIHKLLTYIIATWDSDDDGVLQGEQGNTYDIAFFGPNMYIGALWLAALRAGEELAKLQGDDEFAATLHGRFTKGRATYDELLWNGEYYIQLIDESAPPEDQFGDGCLADQLFGQWWAHLLGLGYILPEEHVKQTLRSIATYNRKHGFEGFTHGYRVFADGDDSGLLVCTWPRGGRPDVPVRYCDEVWTGMEYQVAAHCIMEGLIDEGLGIASDLRRRYDGTKRNPYNEIECGDHYSRAMAGWSLLEALSGLRYDATAASVRFAPAGAPECFQAPVVLGGGWGTYTQERDATGTHVRLDCVHGEFRLRRLTLDNIDAGEARVVMPDGQSEPNIAHKDDELTISFADEIVVRAGETLRIEASS